VHTYEEVHNVSFLQAVRIGRGLGLLARVIYCGEHVIIERRDQPVAALISLEDLRRLEELEDARDAALLKAAKQTSKRRVPFEKLVEQYEKVYGEGLHPNK
jgi:PHD/YefM family antitoxin component YafN of YafNO toxin-antitoxin module